MLSMAHKRNEMYYDSHGIACFTAASIFDALVFFSPSSSRSFTFFILAFVAASNFTYFLWGKEGKLEIMQATHSIVVIPKYECRWLRWVVHDTGKIYRWTALDV